MSTTTEALAKPTIHRNGTSREALIEAYVNAGECVRAAMEALAHASPNGRDYYPQGDGAIKTAMRQHSERLAKLRTVYNDLQEIAEAIAV